MNIERIPHNINTHKSRIRLWADEAIWGHRFYDDQTPWLVILEFLNVFVSRAKEGKALQEEFSGEQHEKFQYQARRLAPLRYIVFNNPYMHNVLNNHQNDGERWRKWQEHIKPDLEKYGWNFDYLRTRFNNFEELCQVIEFFQSTAVELHSNKRWTSRFLYPYGPDTLYTDLDGQGPNLGSNDRRFFARSGELLYLMLNRSQHAQLLATKIRDRLTVGNRWNCLAQALLPINQNNHDWVENIDIGYLPYRSHSLYDQLAEDWLAILHLDLPGPSIFDPLVRITGLNLLLYIIERSHAEAGDAIEHRLVLEIASPKRGDVFELSKENYGANRDLPLRALDAYLLKKWEKIEPSVSSNETAFHELKDSDLCWKPSSDAMRTAMRKPAFEALKDDAHKRHSQHFAKVLPAWSRQIGLSLARRGIGTWYAPNDAFLKTLVLTTVDRQEEFKLFLARLYERYHIVIGPLEAERAYGELPADRQTFAANAARLEMRLRALGLLQHLSDDCAYVCNPFAGTHG